MENNIDKLVKVLVDFKRYIMFNYDYKMVERYGVLTDDGVLRVTKYNGRNNNGD